MPHPKKMGRLATSSGRVYGARSSTKSTLAPPALAVVTLLGFVQNRLLNSAIRATTGSMSPHPARDEQVLGQVEAAAARRQEEAGKDLDPLAPASDVIDVQRLEVAPPADLELVDADPAAADQDLAHRGDPGVAVVVQVDVAECQRAEVGRWRVKVKATQGDVALRVGMDPSVYRQAMPLRILQERDLGVRLDRRAAVVLGVDLCRARELERPEVKLVDEFLESLRRLLLP